MVRKLNTKGEIKMGWEEVKKNEKECNCCIEIEDSIVLIICGEIDIDRLKDTLKQLQNQKG